MKFIKDFFHWLKKRLTIHWQSTLCSAAFIALIVMRWQKVIDSTEFGLMVTGILAFYTAMSKDGNKVVTKKEFQEPDLGVDEDKIIPKDKWAG